MKRRQRYSPGFCKKKLNERGRFYLEEKDFVVFCFGLFKGDLYLMCLQDDRKGQRKAKGTKQAQRGGTDVKWQKDLGVGGEPKRGGRGSLWTSS